MQNNVTILLTATVSVGGMTHTKLVDSNTRRQQYVDAVNYYLNQTKFNVVICNNSGNDFSIFEGETYRKDRFEYIYYQGNSFNPCLGKGYGEYDIIKYAMTHSRLLREAKNVIKITGRIIIQNITEIVAFTDMLLLYPKRKMYINIVYNKEESVETVDSKCFICAKDIIADIVRNDNPVDDSHQYYLETYLYDYLAKNQIMHYPTFAPFVVEGYSGTFNTPYFKEKWGRKERIYYARNFCKLMTRTIPLKANTVLLLVWLSFNAFVFRILKFVLK